MAPTALEKPTHRAAVLFARGRLTVVADNSSLNEILRDIARRAGIKIKGGVIDEQVYGTYGPAGPAEVLAALLKDTSSNMVLAGEPESAAVELVLTPREGGPTPPNPHPAETEVAQNEVPLPAVQDQPATPEVPSNQEPNDASTADTAKPATDPGSAGSKSSGVTDATVGQNQTLASIF